MKYLIIIISLMSFGCLSDKDANMIGQRFCLKGVAYQVSDCCPIIDSPPRCTVTPVRPEILGMHAHLTANEVRIYISKADKECS